MRGFPNRHQHIHGSLLKHQRILALQLHPSLDLRLQQWLNWAQHRNRPRQLGQWWASRQLPHHRLRQHEMYCPWPCRCASRGKPRTGSGMIGGLKVAFAIRVRSEGRTASLAFRCEPGQDAARLVAVVETSFAADSASVVEYSVPATGSLYPRAEDDVSWHVRSAGLGLYVTGEPAEQFFMQVESDASDPREDLPVYLSVDGVSIEFDIDWLQSALPSHGFGRPGCPVSRLS